MYPVAIGIYLIICNLAVIVRLYKSHLRYLTPLKGYAASLLLIGGLLLVDFFVFDVMQENMSLLNASQQTAQTPVVEASF